MNRDAFTTLLRIYNNPLYLDNAKKKYKYHIDNRQYRVIQYTDKDLRTKECSWPITSKGNVKALQGGYVQWTVSGPSGHQNRIGNPDNIRTINVYVHQLIYCMANLATPGDIMQLQGEVRTKDWSFSHLCHHSWCSEPSHITIEPLWVNIRRRICPFHLKTGECTCDDDFGTPNTWLKCVL